MTVSTIAAEEPTRAQSGLLGLFPALIAGGVTGTVVVVLSLSFAVLIFSGQLADHAGTAIGMVLFTGVVVGASVSILGSFRGTIAFPQDKIAPILALMASLIVADTPAGTPPEQLFATVVSALVLATLLVGLLMLMLGLLRLGAFIRYIPYPVIAGFLAGTGLLLVKGSIKVMTGHAPELLHLNALFTTHSLALWLPGLIFALVLLFALGRWKHVATMPCLLIGGIALYHLIRIVLGVGLDEAMTHGFLLGHLAGGDGWRPTAILSLAQADWGQVTAQAGSMATILLISAIGVLLNSSAIELAAREDMDLNRELKVAGLANILSGLGGGIIGFHTLGLSKLVMKMGVRSRLVGLISAGVCLAMLVIGPEPLAAFPKAVLGGLLMYLGLGFLHEWVIESRHQVSPADYGVILMIVGVIGTFGFLQGAAVGVGACVVLFLVNYSRISVAKHELTGIEMRSNVDRPEDEAELLRANGRRTLVLCLQGFMFFGTANKLLTQVSARCLQAANDDEPVRFVVFDFRRVSGMDSSAAMSFAKMRQLAEKTGMTLVFAQMPPQVARILAQAGFNGAPGPFRILPDLDHALESCEEELLRELTGRQDEPAPGLLEDEEIRVIEPYLHRQTVPAGTVIIQQGEPADDLFILHSGRVTVRLTTPEGHSIRLRSMREGTVIGEMGLYLGEPRSASVVADTDCVIEELSAEALTRMQNDSPALAARFHRRMAERLAERLRNTDHMIQALLG